MTPYKLLLHSPAALTERQEMLMTRGHPLNCMASVQGKHMYDLSVIAGVVMLLRKISAGITANTTGNSVEKLDIVWY